MGYATGDATITLTLKETDGSTIVGTDTISESFTVYVVRPSVTLSGPTSIAAESTYTLTLGPVVDSADPSDHPQFYVIHWGDTSPYSDADTNLYVSATATPTGNGSGARSSDLMAMPSNRQFTHVYDDGPVLQGTSTPTNNISVDLLDSDGYWSDVGTQNIVVYDTPPTALFSGNGSVSEGSIGSVLFANQYDVSATDRAAGYTYEYDFNDSGIWSAPDYRRLCERSSQLPLGSGAGDGCRAHFRRERRLHGLHACDHRG